MSNIVETIKADLNAAIENDKLVLPTLPEVALQVRDIAQSEDSSIADLVKVKRARRRYVLGRAAGRR